MLNLVRPMLAAKTDGKNLCYPMLISQKLDGVRALILNGVVVSRSLKPIPNRHVQRLFKDLPEGLDGELIVRAPTAPDVFRTTTSAVSSIEGEPDVVFFVFDQVIPRVWFENRLVLAAQVIRDLDSVELVKHGRVNSETELFAAEEVSLGLGYEDLMLRDPYGPYKFGRSTLNEGWMLKLKRFLDSEAEIIGFVEKMHNGNEAKVNALGLTERSSHKANKVGVGTLGALQVRDLKTGVEFEIGTGFDEATRKQLWQQRPLGQLVKYRYFPKGMKDKPRFPSFLGLRPEWD